MIFQRSISNTSKIHDLAFHRRFPTIQISSIIRTVTHNYASIWIARIFKCFDNIIISYLIQLAEIQSKILKEFNRNYYKIYFRNILFTITLIKLRLF